MSASLLCGGCAWCSACSGVFCAGWELSTLVLCSTWVHCGLDGPLPRVLKVLRNLPFFEKIWTQSSFQLATYRSLGVSTGRSLWILTSLLWWECDARCVGRCVGRFVGGVICTGVLCWTNDLAVKIGSNVLLPANGEVAESAVFVLYFSAVAFSVLSWSSGSSFTESRGREYDYIWTGMTTGNDITVNAGSASCPIGKTHTLAIV